MAVESHRIINHSNFLFFVKSLSPNQMRDRLPLIVLGERLLHHVEEILEKFRCDFRTFLKGLGHVSINKPVIPRIYIVKHSHVICSDFGGWAESMTLFPKIHQYLCSHTILFCLILYEIEESIFKINSSF